jgi:hypothetical protein
MRIADDLVCGCLSDEHAAERHAQIVRRNLQGIQWLQEHMTLTRGTLTTAIFTAQ